MPQTLYLLTCRLPHSSEVFLGKIQTELFCKYSFVSPLPPLVPLAWMTNPLSAHELKEMAQGHSIGLKGGEIKQRAGLIWLDCMREDPGGLKDTWKRKSRNEFFSLEKGDILLACTARFSTKASTDIPPLSDFSTVAAKLSLLCINVDPWPLSVCWMSGAEVRLSRRFLKPSFSSTPR